MPPLPQDLPGGFPDLPDDLPEGPAPDAPARREPLGFFGTLAPSERMVTWAGREWRVLLRPLEYGEEIEGMSYARKLAEGALLSDEYTFCQGLARLSYALLSVNGEAVDRLYPSLAERRQWVAGMDPELAIAIHTEYNRMLSEPKTFLEELHSDPN